MLFALLSTIVWLIDRIIGLYIIVVIAAVVVSWLLAFGVLSIRNDLVVVGHRPQGPLARWFGSIGSYLVKRLRCSVLVGQTEISDDEFERLKPPETASAGSPI